jgi:OOP family OmpA-OmpF porin
MQLSQRRADAVKAALVNRHGISPDRLETQGLGSSQPKGRNDTLQGRKQNRRVELVRIDR